MDTRGTWLQNADSEQDQDQDCSVTIRLPEEMPAWNDSTASLQRIRAALAVKGWDWGAGPR